MIRARLLSSALLAACFATGANAQAGSTWIETAHAAFASAKHTDAGAVGTHQMAMKRFGHAVERLDPGIPAGIPISALALDGTDIYFVTGVTWRMGQTLVTPRDVVKVGPGGGTSLFLKGSQLGLPYNTRIEALSIRGSEVLFSLDIHATIGGLKTRPSDILQRNGSAVSIRHAASTLGIPSRTKLVALDRTASGSLIMAFRNGGQIGGIKTMPGDLMEYHPASGIWTKNRPRNRMGVDCAPCDLNAIATETSATTIFRSGLENHED